MTGGRNPFERAMDGFTLPRNKCRTFGGGAAHVVLQMHFAGTPTNGQKQKAAMCEHILVPGKYEFGPHRQSPLQRLGPPVTVRAPCYGWSPPVTVKIPDHCNRNRLRLRVTIWAGPIKL